MERITKEQIQTWLPKREPDAHKGNFGRVLILAGSRGMMGACILACRAAFRSGSGLVSACCPPEHFSVVQAGVPEATCVPRDGFDVTRYDAAAAGSGLGVTRENYDMICRLLCHYERPVVLDADGLNCLSEYGVPSASDIRSSLVLTPHAGEAARLVNAAAEAGKPPVTPQEIGLDRAFYGKFLAKRLNAVCVMKGRRSLICCPDGRIFENPTGNPGMATGGSGDVLSGMICSFAGQLTAQGAKPAEAAEKAALLGVYLHGLAGDLAAQQWGEAGLMAGDLADFSAAAQKVVAENRPR